MDAIFLGISSEMINMLDVFVYYRFNFISDDNASIQIDSLPYTIKALLKAHDQLD